MPAEGVVQGGGVGGHSVLGRAWLSAGWCPCGQSFVLGRAGASGEAQVRPWVWMSAGSTPSVIVGCWCRLTLCDSHFTQREPGRKSWDCKAFIHLAWCNGHVPFLQNIWDVRPILG